MQLKCPVCGEEIEVEVELVEGQHVRCAACGRVFPFRVGDGAGRYSNNLTSNWEEPDPVVKPGCVVLCVMVCVALIIALAKFHSFSKRSDQGESKRNVEAEEKAKDGCLKNNELGLIWNAKGQVVGAMGHRLGEIRSQMVDAGGRWEEGLMGPRYSRRLSQKVMNFSEVRLEYCQDNPHLWGIDIMAYAGSHRSRGEVNSFIKQLRDRISQENGLDLRLEYGSNEFDTYLAKGATVRGFASSVKLTAIERESGGYIIWLSVNCFDLQRLTY